MMDDFFIFNNIKSTDKNIILKNYTTAFLPANNRRFIDVMGRDGSIPKGSKSKQDIIINCDVAMLGTSQDVHYLNEWLSHRGQLKFWDMLDKYYIGEVIGEIPMTDKETWKEFTLSFRCHPIAYGQQKQFDITSNPTIYNLGTYPTKGTITIEITEGVDHIQVTLQNTGEFIYLGHNFISGDIVTIDLEEEMAYKNGYSIMRDCYLESDFFEIPTGKFEITVSSGKATLEYIERWL